MAVIEAPRVHASRAAVPFTYYLTAPAYPPEHADTGQLAALRDDLDVWLGDHPRGEDAVDVAVELLTNALKYGSRPGSPVTLTAKHLGAGRLEICVRDAGRTASEAPQLLTPGLGQGLLYVENRCERVYAVDRVDGGRTVRAILAAVAPPVIEPDLDEDELEALIKKYADGGDDDDHRDGGVGDQCEGRDSAIGGADRVR